MPSFDPDYYSPLEAAFLFHGWLKPNAKKIDAHFRKLAFQNPISAHDTVHGFVFGNMITNQEMFTADFFAVHDIERFSFQLSLPELDTDAAAFNPSMVYLDQDMTVLEEEQTLRNSLSKIPCCTTDAKGKKPGDPLNVVLIGDLETILAALAKRGWHQTEFIKARPILETIKSFLWGIRYPHSPISALYFLGRMQDFALQKVRGDVQQRIHMRMWLAPLSFRGQPIFIGQVSRDVGVKFWASDQGLTTHVIDPEIDEARASLASDLVYSQALAKIAYVRIAGYPDGSSDRKNLSEDDYFTDGLRVVLFFSKDPVDFKQIEILSWEKPPWERPRVTRSPW